MIGGSGHIGVKLVARLASHGHHAIAASRRTGVDVLAGEGLAAAMAGADAVIDVSRSPSYQDAEVFDFFTHSTRNQLAAEIDAGVSHHVALSVVGAREMGRAGSGFMRAKSAQEELVENSEVPHTIVAATQFFEFGGAIADHATVDGVVRLPPAHNQPIAGIDVARVLALVAVEPPRNGRIELGGPERMLLGDFVATGLAAHNDARPVIIDDTVDYFGAQLSDDTLVPGPDALRGETTFAAWLASGR